MPYQYNRITAPVNEYDVQQALGIGSPNWNDLCTSDNINMWARYKPIRSSSMRIRPVTFNERKGANFGLQIPFCTLDIMNGKVYNIINRESGYENEGWLYLKPRGDRTPQGGIEEFFRITDYCRNPNETTPSANGDPTPVYLQGYNHMAKIPFTAFLNMSGATEKEDPYYGKYYEINKQIADTLVITFFNSGGDDLHLQDFIDLTRTGTVLWRPVLQLFRGFDATPWQNKPQPDGEYAGDAITSDAGGLWSVSMPLGSLVLNQYYHLCVGVGCVNPDFSSWKDNNNSLFILPYTAQQDMEGDYPFYYMFKVVSYQARHLNVTQLKFFQQGSNQWVDASGTAPYFTINSLAADQVRVVMTISKLPGQAVDFIPQNGTPDTGYDPLKIQVREMISGSGTENIRYMTPADSSWQSPGHAHVPAGPISETVTLYATFYISDIPIGGYGEYHLYATTNGVDFDNIGYLSIHKIQYT